jgi:hypothetical protein
MRESWEDTVGDALRAAAPHADEASVSMERLRTRHRQRRRRMAIAGAAAALVLAAAIGGTAYWASNDEVSAVPPADNGGTPVQTSKNSPSPPSDRAETRPGADVLCGHSPTKVTNWDGLDTVPRERVLGGVARYDSLLDLAPDAPSSHEVTFESDTNLDVLVVSDSQPVGVLSFENLTGAWRLATIISC